MDPVTDVDRAATIVRLLQECESVEPVLKAIYDAGFCQRCFNHVDFRKDLKGQPTSLQGTCWSCYESRGD